MDLFSVDFTLNELIFLRQALDIVSIKGTDAKFLANLQIKLESETAQIQQMLSLHEIEKQAALQEVIERENRKAKKELSSKIS
jgi:hypothetical protein